MTVQKRQTKLLHNGKLAKAAGAARVIGRIVTGTANAYRSYKSLTATKGRSGQGGVPSGGSTGDLVKNHKFKQGKGKSKAARKFKGKVLRAMEDEIPITVFVKQQCNVITTPAAGSAMLQNVGAYAMLDNVDMLEMLQGINNTAGSSRYYAERFIMLSMRHEMIYANRSNTCSIIDWYICVPKANSVQTPDQDFVDNLDAAKLIEYQSNLELASNSGAGFYGVTPFMSRVWCQRWDMKSVQRVILQPGEVKQHTLSFGRQYVDYGLFSEGASGVTFKAIKKHTQYLMYIVRGQPVHDSTASGNVAAGAVGLDIIRTKTFRCQAIYDRNGIANTSTVGVNTGNYATVLAANATAREELNPQTATVSTQV